jgi:lipopolysaccharide export system protein LptC
VTQVSDPTAGAAPRTRPPSRGRRWRAEFGGRTASRKFGRSRFVALMKYLLPALAFGLLALVTAWPQLVPDEDRFRLDLAAVGPTGGSKPQVLNPRVLGIDSQSRPFQITADLGSRTQTEDGHDVYHFNAPKADITLSDGSWVAITSEIGRYDDASNTLYLKDNVNLFHDSGYEFFTSAAQFDVTRDAASGDEPVRGQGPFGTLASEGFRILDGGDRVIFTGKARLTIFSAASPSG